MRSVTVVVLDVRMHHGLEMSTTEDEHPVQTFTSGSADEALSEGVGTRCSNRSSDDPDSIGGEDLVEAGRELGITRAPVG